MTGKSIFKVLYVEDDELVLSSTLRILGRFFYNIDTAVNGEEGLDKFLSNRYDIVFTDINMPKMNGIEMIKNIRSHNKSIPIVIFSANSEQESFTKAIHIGIDGYILKPYQRELFEDSVEKAIEKAKYLSVNSGNIFLVDNYRYNTNDKLLYLNEEVVKLTENEQKLFELFTAFSHNIKTTEEIEEYIFGDILDSKRVRNILSRLNTKLDTHLFEAHYGQGYHLKVLH